MSARFSAAWRRRRLSSVLFGIASLAFVVGCLLVSFSWVIAAFYFWITLSGLFSGVAYALDRVEWFGKNVRGERAIWAYPFAYPYIVAMWCARMVQRTVRDEDAYNEVSEGIVLGRIPLTPQELPKGIRAVLDMTAEFVVHKDIRTHYEYVAVPTFDGHPPRKAHLLAALRFMESSQMPIYVHCAAGHGRSASVVVAHLVKNGKAASVSEAEQMLQKYRPKIKLSREQRWMLEEWAESLSV